MFNDKKSSKRKMFFTNKNLKWEITTKDLVTFKFLKMR